MELLVTGFLLLIVLITFYYYLTWNFGYWENQGLKCKKPWPIIGTLTPYWKKSSTTQDSENYKKLGPFYGYYEGSHPSLSVAEPQLLRKIFVKDFAVFPDHRDIKTPNPKDLINKFLTVLEGEEWTTVRHAVSPSFSSKKLKPFIQAADESANSFRDTVLNYVESREQFCLKRIFGRFGVEAIGSFALGLKIDCIQNPNSILFTKLSTIFSEISETVFFLSVLFPTIAKYMGSVVSPNVLRYLDNFIKRLIDLRLKNQEQRNDSLDVLLKHRHVLHPDALSIQAVLFLTQSETLGTVMALFCYEMAINPHYQERLITEIDEVIHRNKGNASYEDVRNMEYLDMTVMEILRKYPPFMRLERVCKEDGYRLNGVTLKYGTLITIPIHSIHHDEKYFPDPEKFDPERFNRENSAKQTPFTYLPFGSGPRSCVAKRLALLSVKMPLIHFFSHFRVKPTPTTEVPLKLMSLSFGSLLLPSLHLHVEKRIDQPQWE